MLIALVTIPVQIVDVAGVTFLLILSRFVLLELPVEEFAWTTSLITHRQVYTALKNGQLED
jgi:hypothetical protein